MQARRIDWRRNGKKKPMTQRADTHSKLIGYALWVFGFTGSHRFYYGRPITGTIWFFTLGLLGIGWLIDLFLIPSMDRQAGLRFEAGRIDYSVAWLLLTFLGLLGIHRMYLGKWLTGILYLLTAGLFGLGYLYDYWTLNRQIAEINRHTVP
jgi:TM2 domain-containing membrane protein YozV